MSQGEDRTREVERELLRAPGLRFSSRPEELGAADFHIVTVPTPIDASKTPDLEPLKRASATIGSVLKRGDIVVYESTVYPGVTEDVCIPVLEKTSGLKWKTDFNVGYSPERINPGDRERRFDNILKIVSADTPRRSISSTARIAASSAPARIARPRSGWPSSPRCSKTPNATSISR